MFLEKFFLPPEKKCVYPYRIICSKMLDAISFSPVTIFYGSNGSGKSTLLNVISEKIGIRHKTNGNNNLYHFDDFVENCAFERVVKNEKEVRIPYESRFIKSDDIMEAIVNLRHETEKIIDRIKKLQEEMRWIEEDDYVKMYRVENEMKTLTQTYNHELTEQSSNGEAAMAFFETVFKADTLYLLDEPENSLSPALQLKLKKMIERYSSLLGCQFIIATHSPFLLAIENATVYNLDSCPSRVCKWSDLENVRTYYDFFMKHKDVF